MPRRARNDLITSYSHVIVQGIEKSFVFKENYFKELYLSLIKKYLEETSIEILGYCVMDNHVHIIMYLNDLKELGHFMQKINTSFAVKYNKIKNRVGFVFRNRYYLQPITSERQLYNCLVYVHRNPLAAKMVSRYEEYKYSSYNEFIKKRDLITDNGVKMIFGSNNNYLKTFEKIHQDRIIEDIRDVPEYIDEKIVLRDFFQKYGKSIDEIKKDKLLLKEIIEDLKEKSGLSLRMMENILQIGKDKINNILKK